MDTLVLEGFGQLIDSDNTLEETRLYRGVDNSDYPLLPSAGRFGIEDQDAQLDFEKALLKDFKRGASFYIDYVPENDLEWLMLAQHHGLPTRLMDWTYSPLVALFFAVENDSKADAALYVSYKSRGFDESMPNYWDDPFGISILMHVEPTQRHMRHKNQNGLFTVHPTPSNEDLSKVIRKYLIPYSLKNEIRYKLRKNGVSRASLFSDLDSLAYDVVRMNRIKYAANFKGI